MDWERKGPDMLSAGPYTVTRFRVAERKVFRAFCSGKDIDRNRYDKARDAMQACEDHAKRQR